MPELCRICHTRRPKRHCPGIEGEICSLCCGDQREVNISCPLDCPHLREARLHERPAGLDPGFKQDPGISLTEKFLDGNEELIFVCGYHLAGAALQTPGATDLDVAAALDSLVRTYKTLDSGLVYESRPGDRVAAAVQDHFRAALAKANEERVSDGGQPFRNADVLGVLSFLHVSALSRRNGRPRGRAFIDFLRTRLKMDLPRTTSELLLS